ncbi:MAG: protein kinase, partial [Pyrinomonadaceae bacterium]
AEDATLQMIKTQPGMVMGSVRYMSPEQARGKETDERTDVWSLGVVLYEMLCGKNPFEGETISDSLAALIHIEPPPLTDVPEELYRIIRKSLRKNASERYQNIKDFALDLKDLRLQIERNSAENQTLNFNKTTSFDKNLTSENKTLIHQTFSAKNDTDGQEKGWVKTQVNTISTGRNRRFLPLILLALCGILAFSAWFYLPALIWKSAPKFQSIQVSQLTNNGNAHFATISPDSKLVAFINAKDGRESIIVRQVSTDSSVEIVPLAAVNYFQPTFSPDGQFVYYVSFEKNIGTLYRVATLGGQSKKIAYDVDSKITFSPDGKQFAFIRHNPTDGGDTIFISDSEGTNLHPFIGTKETGYDKFTSVSWSPDNKRLLLSVFKLENEPTPKIQIATAELNNKTLQIVGEKTWYNANFFEWFNDGTGIVFIGKANLSETMQIWHLSFPSGELRQISSDTSDYASLSVSADGNTIVATKVDVISSIWSFLPNTKELRQLTGESRTLVGGRGISQTPDGKILYSKKTGKEINIFAMDENGGNEKQLTAENGFNFEPISTSDNRFIVFSSNRDNAYSVWKMNTDGSNAVRLTKPENAMDGQLQVTGDSRNVVFARQKSDGGKSNLMKVSIDGGKAEPLLPESKSSDLFSQISPDGNQLAYHTFEVDGGISNFKSSVKIVGLNKMNIEKSSKEIELSLDHNFKWSPGGNSLTYINKLGTDNLWSVSLDDKKEKQITEFNSGNITNFAWSRNGKKLFIVRGIVNSDLILIKDTGKFS